MIGLARLAQRWDIDAETAAARSFDDGLAIVNLRRVELCCLLALANDALQLLFAYFGHAILIEVILAALMLAAVRPLERLASPAFQRAIVVAVIGAALLTTQWTVMQIAAATGQVTSGYLIRLLTLTLLFVLPARTLVIILAIGLITYCAAILTLPVPRKLSLMVNGAIVSGISLVAGSLIYAARRRDHDQKLLIRSQNARLAMQNTELDQLMAITAHDLRSPLFGLRNLLDLASRRAPQEPSLAIRVLHDGIASLDGMLALVTRLLDAHQAEHAPLGASVQEDLRLHVRAAARRIAPLAEGGAVTIDLALPPAPLLAEFDAGALAQILDNLLGNAIRYGPAGESVHIAAHAFEGRAVITVEDHGPGVDPATRATMFGKFHRGVVTGPSDKAGTGMGLFIAATCAARIGGSLSYRPGEAAGAIFELALPLTDHRLAASDHRSTAS